MTFERLLATYQIQIKYAYRMAEYLEKGIELETINREYLIGYTDGIFTAFQSMKDYCSGYNPVIQTEDISKFKEIYGTEIIGYINYRELDVPIYKNKEDGKQFIELNGKRVISSMECPNATYFCYFIDKILDIIPLQEKLKEETNGL